jgi:malonyl CoA-acyl carrier protein transacylase
MTTYVFPGQGSQSRGMGAELFAAFPELVKKADDILGYSIQTLCLEDPGNQLNQTNFTQPALYVVSALAYLKKMQEGAQRPHYVAGHSLGEYNALFAAEVFDFETGLKLVQKRGELMSQAQGGGMAAIVGLTSDQVKAVLEKNPQSNVSIANYNSVTQVVISGPKDAVMATEPLFTGAGATLFIPLKVSGAFHSALMMPAQKTFADFIQSFHFSAPTIPVIANVDAKPYTAANIVSNLSQQITSSVLWTQTIQYLISQGEDTFEEVGPGKVLTGLIARIKKGQ